MAENSVQSQDVENTANEIISNFSAAWAKYHKLKLGKDTFSLVDRPYLIEPFMSRARKKGGMKATQGGWSIWAIVDSIHGLIYGIIRNGVLYLFPSAIDMNEYSKSVLDPLIKDNRTSIGKYVKAGGKGTDTAGLKKIGHGNLYLRGARLNPTDMGGATSSRLSGIAVGRVVYDEVDFMDSAVIADAQGRMAAIPEEQRQEIYLANPSAEDFGIALLWGKSDQRWLYHPCTCGQLNCPTRDFINDPEGAVGIYPERGTFGEERGYMRCKKCGKPVNVLNCQYIPDFPSRTEYIFWQWSHLSFINSNPARILRDFRNPPEGNLAGVYKNDLGLPYSSAEDKLTKHVVLANCGNDGMPERHHGPCAIGVDNDDNKHIVILIRTGPDRYEAVKMARLDNFNAVYDLIKKFNIRSGVVDMKPNKDSATQFQKAAMSIGCRIFLCDYTDSPLQDANFNENTGVVKVYRTGIFDTTHRIISNQQIVLPRQSPTVEEFARQCCNCAKQKDEKRKDVVIYRYVKTGDQQDHYRNALNYAITACMGHRIGITRSGNRANNLEKFVVREPLKL